MQALPPFPAKTWKTPTDADWRTRCIMFNGHFAALFGNARLRSDPEVARTFARTAEAENWRPSPDVLTEEQEDKRYRFVEVDNGLRIGYIEEGNPTAPLVLFVHGFPDTLWTWVRA